MRGWLEGMRWATDEDDQLLDLDRADDSVDALADAIPIAAG